MATSAFLRPFETTMAAYTDAPPIFHRANALTLMGAMFTREDYRCIVHGGVAGMWLNLWCILIGDSGDDHKSTSMRMMQEVLKLADPDLQGPSDMSPEGLAQRLYRRQATPSGASAIFVQSEFVNLLMQFRRQYSNTLRPMLMSWYDVEPYERQLRNSSFVIDAGRISMVGGITHDLLAQFGTLDDWHGGFFNRCLFITGKKVREQMDDPQIPLDLYGKFAKKLTDCADTWKAANTKRSKDKFRYLTFSKKALEVGRSLQAAKKSAVGNTRTMLSRTSTHFTKVAAIEQMDEDPTSPEVGVAAAKRAAEFVAGWQENVPLLVEQCLTRGREDFEGDRLSKTILRFVLKHGRVGYRDILASCGLNVTQVDQALRSLEAAKRIENTTDQGSDCDTMYQPARK